MDSNTEIFAAVTDLETTGLDAALDVPLELGIKLIDKEGFVFAEASWLIWEHGELFQDGVVRGRSNPIVMPMHEKSGLWDDLSNISLDKLDFYSRESVDQEVEQWLADNGAEYGKVPMMGNSIGSLDRPFAILHLPRLNKALSYRNIDMSSVRLLCQANNKPLFENLKKIVGTSADSKHRVLDDIDGCITEYRAYRENFFFLED